MVWSLLRSSEGCSRRLPAPPVAERLIAMVQLARLDAVNSIDRKYRPLLVQLPAEAEGSSRGNCLRQSRCVVAGGGNGNASLLAPATTALIDVPAPTVEVLT
jgi:hypothetical protein